MKKLLSLVILLSITCSLSSQEVLSLDSCRALALANNKDLQIGNEKIKAAYYERKAAFTNFLPNISATGSYMTFFIYGKGNSRQLSEIREF